MSKEAEIWELRKKYAPKAEHLTSIREVAKETGLPLRKVRYCVSHRELRKTIRKGRESYFERAYIFSALDCLAILEEVFKLPLRKIRKIMLANDSSIKTLHEKIEIMLDKYPPSKGKPVHYYLIEQKFLDQLASGNLAFDFSSLENEAKNEYDSGK